jgi:hypothetical protein
MYFIAVQIYPIGDQYGTWREDKADDVVQLLTDSTIPKCYRCDLRHKLKKSVLAKSKK